MFLLNSFSHVFVIFNFWPKLTIFAKAIALAWAIAFLRWPIFKIVSFLQNLVFFSSGFSIERLYCYYRRVFCMFLEFFNLDPNWPFCKGYSLSMGSSLYKMADFQNSIISRIFSVFSSCFLHRTTIMFLKNVFFFHNLTFLIIFDPNWPFCQGYSLCMDYSLFKMADCQNCLISPIFGVFSSSFFSYNDSNVLVE